MMKNQLFVFLTTVAVSSSVLAQACQLSGATPIAASTTWNAGPNVVAAATANPLVTTAVYSGQDAWDASDAINRFTGYSGTTSASDCPFSLGSQIGAFGFAGTGCQTNIAYGVNAATTLAYVDYYTSVCAGCGTNSLSVNLNFVFSVSGSPLAGEYHLADVVAHEFGHMLGLAHQNAGTCGGGTSTSCAATPTRETMQTTFWPGPGETCNSTIETPDINAANVLY